MGIVERVRSLAEKNGHTIASVERELGFGQGSIRNWNKAAPSADKLYKVAKLFNVSMEYILTGEGQAAEKDADAIRGISDDALKVGCLWDGLDEAGQSDHSRRYISPCGSHDYGFRCPHWRTVTRGKVTFLVPWPGPRR